MCDLSGAGGHNILPRGPCPCGRGGLRLGPPRRGHLLLQQVMTRRGGDGAYRSGRDDGRRCCWRSGGWAPASEHAQSERRSFLSCGGGRARLPYK